MTSTSQTTPLFDDEDIIFRYTRAEAIADGVLIDVSEMGREAGIRHPVALTQRVWEFVVPSEDLRQRYGQSEEGRLWDVLMMFVYSARNAGGQTEIRFLVEFLMKPSRSSTVELKAHCGPGDEGEPVITIMMPDED